VEKIGKYRILGKIGEGGMGVVYKALDPLLERVVAVKTIVSRLDSDPYLRTRFFREGRSAAHLSHKNIITIYDLGEDNGVAYMVMEFLDGEDLRAKMHRDGRQSLESKLGIMFEICSGLAHAHGRQVIHRDVKPANIFITASGQVKILDFGLARLMSTETTRTGAAQGSPNYMSPEQVRGDDLDHRTDVFSAGALLYELLTSKKPFEGESLTTVIFNIMHHEPAPPHVINPAISPQLSSLVMKLLAKRPEERYQSMMDVIHDLRECSPYVRSLPVPQPESEEASALSQSDDMEDLKTILSLPGVASTPDEPRAPASASNPAVGIEAAPRSFPHRRQVFILAVVAFVVIAMASAGLWRVAHHAEGSVAAAKVPQAPRVSGPVEIGLPGKPPGKLSGTADDSPVSVKAPEPARASLHESLGDRSHRAVSGSQGEPPGIQPAGVPKGDTAPTRGPEEPAKSLGRRIEEAKSLPAQGRYLEASAGARELPKIAPTDPSVKRLAVPSADIGKQAADDASAKMMESKRRAEEASAGQYAPKSIEAAQGKESSAQAAYDAKRYDDAAAGFLESSGLYLGAALEAGSEKTARENRTKVSEQERLRAVQRQQADSSRNAYEQAKLDAVRADAESKATPKYQEALQFALDASSKWDREDYPGSRTDFVKAADTMRQAESAAREAARKPDPPAVDANAKPAVLLSPPSSSLENSRQAINSVLQQYSVSLQSKDLPALRNIWPGLGGEQEKALQEEFRNAREIRVKLADTEIRLTGDSSATATARRTYVLVTVDGRKLQTESGMVIDLRRSGRVWLIDRIHFEAR
jgi:serine/threonine protein kinase